MEVPIGAIAQVPAGRGIVRFAGGTDFAPGKWVGIELYEPNGKNNGTVNGKEYFACEMNYGMFVRASQVKVIQSSATPVAAVSAPQPQLPTPPSVNRPTHKSSGSISASPSPAALPRPTPTRSMTNRTSPSTSSTRASSPLKPGHAASLNVPRTTTARLIPPTPLKRAPVTPVTAASILSPTTPRHFRTTSLSRTPSQQNTSLPRVFSQQPEKPALEVGRSSPVVTSPTISAPRPLRGSPEPLQPEDQPPISPAAVSDSSLSRSPIIPMRPLIDESQELKVKLRVLETKRADDARHIRELETKLQEAETFVALRPKLQAKLQSLQTDNLALKRQLADTQTQITGLEAKMEEQTEQMEMAMLDKEVAEEKAEVAEGELEVEKEAKAQLEVELEVWRTGKAAGTGEGGEGQGGRSEMEFRQMEKHNERLKDALIRLREITQESEQEQRKRIADLEKELASVDDLHSQYTQTIARLEHADLQVDDLKQQLDDALGAEDMLVQLTERNLLMGEKIEEMRVTIEDLEALQELNNELEEAHIETEKALQEDLEQREVELREQFRKIDILQEGLQDYETTVQQFRDLVGSLQSELEGLRQQHQTRETESQAQATQAAAIMSLNMRLQSTATRNQAKNIDMELRRLDAMQAREMLSIVQPYLPQVYVESDSGATNCYMFFQRVAFKTDLINSVVGSQYGLPESLNGPISDKLVGVCDLRGRIAHLSTLCKRLAAILRRCDVETFINAGQVYPEVAPLEKRLDMHIDLLRREEFREVECLSDVVKMLSRFEHLAETYIATNDFDLGERELQHAIQVDHDLDTLYAAIGLTKASVDAAVKDDEVIVELGDLDLEFALVEPLQTLLERSKPTRNASKKLLKRIEEVVNESGAFKPQLLQQFTVLTEQMSKLIEFAIPCAQAVGMYVGEARAQKHSFELSAVLANIRQVAGTAFGNTGSPWDTVGDAISAMMQEITGLLSLMQEKENVIKITGESPWVVRVEEVKQLAAINVDAERTVAKLQDEILALVRGVRTRDQTIQEGSVKIELMERRMETVRKQADAITELENQLSEAHKSQQEYQDAMESVQADLDSLEQENEALKKMVETASPVGQNTGARAIEDDPPVVESNYEMSHLLEQIDGLRGTVRFLRSENSFLKGQDLLKDLHSLPDLIEIDIPTPPLSPSTSSSKPPLPDSPPTRRSLTTETTLLFREVIEYSSKPRVVDLSALNSKKPWIKQKHLPSHQLWLRKQEGEKLQKRVKGLLEKSGALELTLLPTARSR